MSVSSRQEAVRIASALVSGKVLLPVNTSRFVDNSDKFYRLGDTQLYRRRVQLVATTAAADNVPIGDDSVSGLSAIANSLFRDERPSDDNEDVCYLNFFFFLFIVYSYCCCF